MEADLLPMLATVAAGTVPAAVTPSRRAAVCVTVASGGYPGQYATGIPIGGIEDAEAIGGVQVFHAGTARRDGRLVTSGGRVLGVTAVGDDVPQAIEAAYEAVARIRFDGMHFRRDIGRRRAVAVYESLVTNPIRVGIVLGSDSDLDVMLDAVKVLDALEVGSEVVVASAHRTPRKTEEYASTAEARGLGVLIGAAGGAAALPGVLAASTSLPVIGVPIAATPLGGMDALLSIVQMPKGVPVATVAIGAWGAANAGILAAQILSVGDAALRKRLAAYRQKLAGEVEERARRVADKLKSRG
jgi:phosphoribosylamine--glycine ligase